MKSKLKHLLAGALLILPLALQAFTGLQAVSAADTTPTTPDPNTTTTVELTKLVFPQGEHPDLFNNGAQNTNTGGTPVEGVEFQAYNITDAFNSTTKDAAAIKNIQDDAAAGSDADLLKNPVSPTPGVTDKNGVVDFALPNAVAGKYQTYLILETKYTDPETNSDNTIVEKSTPLVLTMPLNTAKSGDKVYLYPKNFDQPSIKKDLTDTSKDTLGLGDTADYTITAQVPFDITSRDQFVVTDTPDQGLDDLLSTVAVKADGQDVPFTPTATAEDGKGAGFKLTFDPSKMAAFAGHTLSITYTAQVTQQTVANLQNHAGVTFGRTPHIITSEHPIKVGGAKFVKENASDTTKKLADAVFVLETTDGKIVTMTKDDAGKDVYHDDLDASKLNVQDLNAAVEDKTGQAKVDAVKAELKSQLGDGAENAVLAESNGDGKFEFTGLKYGDYHTVELAAPKGFALATDFTKFTVSDTSYDDNEVPVTNTPKGILPHTGGMGIYLVIALGLIVMGAGYVVLKKGSHHQEV
ncbi:SpaH/EbpB family LPXTG-anchored major pilin [Lacticaseibacillus sp. N501-2]|uniref:SpaH/EbpB family LPXTG-anchored major pilin n=1 Tax=Lacticaseibacillus salsurae TaxID=3367729 RepID=UPI0038B28F65